jgi:ATP-dependent Clp protease ATP-binding subunit ClpA
MAVARFTEPARAIVRQAEKEAEETGSPTLEAEHLLLAMTAEHGTEARDVLASVGLDRDGIRAASSSAPSTARARSTSSRPRLR